MKILVFSDSHGDTCHMKKAIARHPDCEVIFFLGDGLSDIDFVLRDNNSFAAVAVKGNCDSFDFFKGRGVMKTEKITLSGKTFIATHGDLYGVKWGIGQLLSLAQKASADVVLFGHTHVPYEKYFPKEKEDGHDASSSHGCYLFNPGSIGGTEHTYGVITLTEGGILFSHGSVKDQ